MKLITSTCPGCEATTPSLWDPPYCTKTCRERSETAKPQPVDIINPSHYKTKSGMEAIDVIEAFELGYHLGSVAKYILRADKKGPGLTDLKKARWFLDREIAAREGK